MTIKLLLVDDNPADRAIVRRMLGSCELDADLHEINCAADLLSLPLDDFDCALVDVRLPDKDGIDALGEVSKGASYPPLPVIIMSGLGDEHTAARAFKAGANDYLIKDSLTPNTLRRTVVNAIDKWHAEDAMRNDWEMQQHALITAERANKAKARFISDLSHQLRIPLTAIIGFSEMIEIGGLGNDEKAWERYKDYAGDISRSAREVLELVSGVIDLSRVEFDEEPVVATTFDPRETLREVIESFSNEVGVAKVDLRIDDQQAPVSIHSDGRAVQAIMTNLLSNAIKFTPAGQYVRVQLCEIDGEKCLFSVADTGVGMDPEDLTRLTRPFERYKAQVQASGNELGIGLPLVNSLVRVLGGELNFDTAPGMGTTATVVLPKHVPDDNAA